MLRKHLARFAPLLLPLALYGCAASDDGRPNDPNDDLTSEEQAAGAEWSAATPAGSSLAEDGVAHDDDHGVASADAPDEALASDLEDSAPFLDVEDAKLFDPSGIPLPELDDAEVQAVAKCQKATGYSRGKKMTICVTTVDGKQVEVNTARAFLRMRKAAAARGAAIKVVSGFRTMTQQRYLYNCYKTKRCNGGNLAAPPGYSNHQSGHALDLNTRARGVYSYLSSHGKTYGFKRTVPSERWHWEQW